MVSVTCYIYKCAGADQWQHGKVQEVTGLFNGLLVYNLNTFYLTIKQSV
jgi:hypothetical protein